jgi:hypothetical protein
MDGLKVGGIKSPHAGYKSGLMCTTQMKNWKIKKRQIYKQIELDSTNRRSLHKNERIKKSQWILPVRIAAVHTQTPPHILQRSESVSKIRDIRLGQLYKRWNADSSSILQAMPIGSSIRPMLCRCLFNGQCPVMSPTKILNFDLGSLSKYLVKPGLGFFSHILDWQQAVCKLLEAQCDLNNRYRSLRLTIEGANRRQGSGSTKTELDPDLASASASSFPWIPQLSCHTKNYLSLIFRKINDFVHRFILDPLILRFWLLILPFYIVNFTDSLLILRFHCWFYHFLLKSTI